MNEKNQLIEDIKLLTKSVEDICIEAAEHIDFQNEELPNAYELMMYVLEEAYQNAVKRANSNLNTIGNGEIN